MWVRVGETCFITAGDVYPHFSHTGTHQQTFHPHFSITHFTHRNNSVFEYYSNNIRITNYSYSYSVIFGRPNIIRIRIRSFSEGRILFVFVFGHFWKTEYYSYSYSVIFRRPNIIRIRIRSFSEGRILFVFVFGHFRKAE